MSVLQNPVRHQPFARPANLNRWLLLCRFDFQQRSWGLPAWEVRRDSHAIVPAHSAALASAVSKNLSDFSDPSRGGTKPSKIAIRRIGIRHALRPLRTTKQPTKEK
jgi:hypothetical protein